MPPAPEPSSGAAGAGVVDAAGRRQGTGQLPGCKSAVVKKRQDNLSPTHREVFQSPPLAEVVVLPEEAWQEEEVEVVVGVVVVVPAAMEAAEWVQVLSWGPG